MTTLLEYAQDHISPHVTAVVPAGMWEGMMVFDFEFDRDDLLLGSPEYLLMDADDNIRVTQGNEGFAIFDMIHNG